MESVHLTVNVPKGVLELTFWGKEQLDGQTHEGSVLTEQRNRNWMFWKGHSLPLTVSSCLSSA